MNNPLDFTGKVALVTGAAAGMGLATAEAFAEAGAAVVLADFKEDAVKAEATCGHTRISRRLRLDAAWAMRPSALSKQLAPTCGK